MLKNLESVLGWIGLSTCVAAGVTCGDGLKPTGAYFDLFQSVDEDSTHSGCGTVVDCGRCGCECGGCFSGTTFDCGTFSCGTTSTSATSDCGTTDTGTTTSTDVTSTTTTTTSTDPATTM